jgi:hypothetical protein
VGEAVLVCCPRNTLQKTGTAFIPRRNKQMLVGQPSLAALNGGHGGPPYLRVLKNISGT